MKQIVTSKAAPTPKGPYNQAVQVGGFLFVSGQGPVDPGTGEFVTDSFAAQVEQTLDNIRAIVEAAGASMDQVAKVTVYLSDLAMAAEFNEIYAQRVPKPWPARSICQSAMVGIDVAVDAIVAVPE